MTEKELREKIAKHVCCACEMGLGDGDCAEGSDFKKCGVCLDVADALIAEGIGDVSEYKRLKTELRSKVDYIHELWDVKEDYKRRAEVAERAVREFAVQVGCRSCPFNCRCGITNPNPENDYEECYKEALQQAEKELQEKRKND